MIYCIKDRNLHLFTFTKISCFKNCLKLSHYQILKALETGGHRIHFFLLLIRKVYHITKKFHKKRFNRNMGNFANFLRIAFYRTRPVAASEK